MTTALGKGFDPANIEKHWYHTWTENECFKAGLEENKESFCILLPPPNVTGTLHMGHGFNQTIMDILTRYHRMLGNNTLWQPGTDHAGIATQIVVERLLESEGKTRHKLGREAFLDKVWEWKNFSGNSIISQMKRLGTSQDWSRQRFTMDDSMSQIVIDVFVRLYQDGLIYRGKRLVNWDPKLGTAVSDLEVKNCEEKGKIYSIRYPIAGDNNQESLVIATTRPETLLGDTAVAVHPDDPRYQKYIGQSIALPLTNRTIPIVADYFVDPEFETGCVKVTPAHDFNDWQIGQRHGLDVISILNEKAIINDNAPKEFQGLDRFTAREAIVNQLNQLGLLTEIKDHVLMIPRGDRTDEILEPLLTDQWFVATTKKLASHGKSLAELALECSKNKAIRFTPEHWQTTYNQWLEDIQDWCISRQLWWGHQIPAWYGENGEIFVAHCEEEARRMADQAGYQGTLQQDEDVLDTWFSSALWPFSTLDWKPEAPNNPLIERYLPSSTLVTGFDILFFWVARMVMMTRYVTHQIPFKDIYVHGLIRDTHGQKMSKSKGNTLDPIDIIDGVTLDNLIKKRTTGLMKPDQINQITKNTKKEFPQGITPHGTDAVRFTYAVLASPGRDINFDMSRCQGYRNFCNKLWNATRFALMNCLKEDASYTIDHENILPSTALPNQWIENRLQQVIQSIKKHLESYRFDLLAQALYNFIWNDFCDWYLESTKVLFSNNQPDTHEETRQTLLKVLDAILRLAHPVIPFITEELWQHIAPITRGKTSLIMMESYPELDDSKINQTAAKTFEHLQTLVNACRNLRGEMNISPAEKVPAMLAADPEFIKKIEPYLMNLGKLKKLETTSNGSLPHTPSPTFISNNYQIMLSVEVDVAAETERLKKEINSTAKTLQGAQAKLNNANFTSKAPPAVVEKEEKQFEDAQERLKALEDQLAVLKKSQ